MLTQAERVVFDFARGVGAVDTPSSEDIERVISDLAPLQGNALLVGGIAVIHHGYRRLTVDVDLIYATADREILKRLKPKFKLVTKARSGWHKLEHKETKVRVELIPEGGLTTYGFIPGPEVLESDGAFVSLKGLMWMKLVSGRAKDEADIVEVAKANMKAAVAARKHLPSELLERYDAMIARARSEIENDPYKKKK